MNCDICEDPTTSEKGICDKCNRIMEEVIRGVGEDFWSNIDDCKYIYPMVKRVAEGSLRTQDIVNELLKGEAD
jgi:disulfide oxidoreductase YuzD